MENLYIQSTLNAQQAFEAMQAGKNVVCKAFGNTYDTLDNFPATVFFKPDYEFAIALQTKILNDISFTIPLSIDEVEQDQEVYLVEPSAIKKVKFQNQVEVLRVIKNGFAQRDEENAVNHLKAICLSLGISEPDFEIEEITQKTKRANKKVEDKQIAVTEKPAVLVDEIETDSEKLYEKFAGQINVAESDDAVTEIRYTFQANSHLSEKHSYMLQLDCERRFGELSGVLAEEKEPTETEYYAEPEPVVTQPIDDGLDQMIPISKFDEIKVMIQEANSDADLANASDQILANARHLSSNHLDTLQAEHMAREELIKLKTDLISRASNANSPAEANALITYTKSWDEADRKSVLDAINARLLVLSKPELKQQSLAVRIQNAESFEQLEELRAEVNSCDPAIQERLFSLIKDREISLTF